MATRPDDRAGPRPTGAAPPAPPTQVTTGGAPPPFVYVQPSGSSTDKYAPGGAANPWAVLDKTGRLRYVTGPKPPQGVITYHGVPRARQWFQSFWEQRVTPTFQAYTGRDATAAQAAQIAASGISNYALEQQLANTSAFRHSPIWKQRSGSYIAIWRQTYGPRSKPDVSLIGTAIVQGLDGTAFHAMLAERPDYVQSGEFKTQTATMRSAYEAIYGPPNENAGNAIRQATLAGWSPEQFQQYLRAQPEYKFTPEYESKKLTMLDALGLITGRVATLKPTKAGMPEGQAPPMDERLPAAAAPAPAGPMLAVGTR